ncbi:c-type cytochrome [Sphingobium sp. H39-3-25]|uniref:c-type cytochrome n=1 Tax=Sphingobium arseniciresistens TaxID=3030834 RepID=UPI0023B8E2F3|nr:c-type cytochrome [Sphingobium arseniciresistens]
MKPAPMIAALVPLVLALSALTPLAASPAVPPAANQCMACHTVQKGVPSGVGPNLNGVYGRLAGTAPGFNYSSALKASKLRWDDRTLDAFLAAPIRKVPGTRMTISVPDPARRAALIAWLKGLHAK